MVPADFEQIEKLTQIDIAKLKKAEKYYGDSWLKRGGVGAFMMLARKWDRIEFVAKKDSYDIFSTIQIDSSDTGILDDIRDLRRYLFLVEAYMLIAITKRHPHLIDESLKKGDET